MIPVKIEVPTEGMSELEASIAAVQKIGKFSAGDRAVITSGLSAHMPGSTSVMEIREFR